MKNMEELKAMLCDELDEITAKGEISFADLDSVEKLTASIKNLDKIIMADRYSEEGSSRGYMGDYNSGNYRDGMRDGMRDGGSYRNGGGYSSRSRHYVRGHYSYGDESAMLGDKIEEMISDGRMSANEKRILKDALEIIRK